MSSRSESRATEPEYDDRTMRARIRDAAIECIARDGLGAFTARSVADAAGVSAASVIKHFGSMDGLRVTCDEYVAAVIRRHEIEAFTVGPSLDVLAALRGSEVGWSLAYLAAVLADDSPSVARLFDELLSDAEGYMQVGEESGMLRPTANPRGRAAVLLVWSLGAMVLHRHVKRIFGVDLTDPEIADDPAVATYAGPAYQIMDEGIFTESFAATLNKTLAEAAGLDGSRPEAPSEAKPETTSKSKEAT